MKPAVVHFEPSSIYGTRVGYHDLLLVTAAGKGNMFHKSKLWRTGVVAGVSMLPRNDMAKPARDTAKYGSETRFTRVQEMKQARGPEHTKSWFPSRNPYHLMDSVFDSRRYDIDKRI